MQDSQRLRGQNIWRFSALLWWYLPRQFLTLHDEAAKQAIAWAITVKLTATVVIQPTVVAQIDVLIVVVLAVLQIRTVLPLALVMFVVRRAFP